MKKICITLVLVLSITMLIGIIMKDNDMVIKSGILIIIFQNWYRIDE